MVVKVGVPQKNPFFKVKSAVMPRMKNYIVGGKFNLATIYPHLEVEPLTHMSN
jgi:hypothetical protein